MSQCLDCHAGCCRSFAVPITGADVLRIERSEPAVAPDDAGPAADAVPATVRAKLAPDTFRALEVEKRETQSEDIARRATAWQKIQLIHAAQGEACACHPGHGSKLAP